MRVRSNAHTRVLLSLTSSLTDLSWLGGVAGDACLSRSGRTLLVRWPGVPRLLFSPERFRLMSVPSPWASSSSGVGGSGRLGGPPPTPTPLLLPPLGGDRTLAPPPPPGVLDED
uniref:Putative secreted protein n=1 Tax=Anopheles triannulatus TaxID=58253 RepID=A0A2M4B350_9DIPT